MYPTRFTRPLSALAVLLALGALIDAARATAGPEGAPPNVLVLLADDLGVDQLASYGLGSDLPQTPMLDNLANAGMRFTRCWSNPYCSPTRATLMTGRFSFRTGIGVVLDAESESLSLNEFTLPEMLDAGTGGAWSHALLGKWHLGNPGIDLESGLVVDPGSGGLDHPLLSGWGGYAGGLHNLQCPLPSCNGGWWNGELPFDYFFWPKVESGVETLTTTYATTETIDDAIAWIGNAAEPWLCFVAFHAPHAPFQAPPAELSNSGLTPGEIATSPGTKRPYYKAMVEALDSEIGRLLTTMAAPVLSNTLVVFLADNGTPAPATVPPFDPSHAKGTVYEGGVNVPLIVWGPGVTQPGATCGGLVNTTDLFATVAEVAGVDLQAVVPPGTQLDSVSFLPYLSDPGQPSIRPFVFTEVFHPIQVEDHCQKDFGNGGPGLTQIDVCGDHLFAGGSATFRFQGAEAFTPTILVASTSYDPLPFSGGVLGPSPILSFVDYTTDERGEVVFDVVGELVTSSFDLYVQVITPDVAQPQGWSLSNTVRVRWPEELAKSSVVAARDDSYKLIRVLDDDIKTGIVYGRGLTELLYDVRLDPFEQVDLLTEGPLSDEAQAAYTALSGWLSLQVP